MVLDALRKRLWVGLGVVAVTSALILAPAAVPAAGRAAAAQTTVSLTASRFGKGAAENRPAKIVVANANADGSGSRVLTTGWYSFVSPDGSQVAVIDSDVNADTNLRLELYASSGGAPRHAIRINCGGVVWSPDSTKLACVEGRFYDEAKPSRLLLIDAASGAKTTLAKGVFDSQISFSPDSTSLVYVQKPQGPYFSAGSALKVIDLATRAVRMVRAGGVASPAWGPTEIAFAVLKPRGRTFTLDTAVIKPDGSGFRRLTRFRPTQELFGPHPVAWSADGTRLLAGMIGLDAWTYNLSYAVDASRGGSRLIANGVHPTALSRDGRYLIGQTWGEGTRRASSTVVRVPWTGGKPQVLLRQAVFPSFNG